MEVHVGPASVTIHSDDRVVVCEPDSKMSSNLEQGFFARDTRFVSGYRLKLGRVEPQLVNSSDVEHYSSRFEFTNPDLDTPAGRIPAGALHLRLDRTVGSGVHEDYDVTNHSRQPVTLGLEVSLESDFSDIFDVKAHKQLRRGSIQSTWSETSQVLTTNYQNGTFRRGIEFRATKNDSPTEFANGGLNWRIVLEPLQSWHTCLLWSIDLREAEAVEPTDRTCHALRGRDTAHDRMRRDWTENTTRFTTSDPRITLIVSQAVEDLASLRMHSEDESAWSWQGKDGDRDLDSWVPAAGIPWFVSVFGRDSLVVSLQTLSLAPRFTLGALRALGRLQGDGYDDARDMQPGKIEHEVRQGELATLHLIPHTPYYGTHDATTLYVLAASRSWWWHGDRAELDAVRPHVERALAWIDRDGDADGDGLQEYKSRAASGGYYNQGWKDSGDAIVDEHGEIASLPIALCEHQGYVVAAKRAWAEILERVYDDSERASTLRREADNLSELIEERFWWEEEGTYYLGLDGDKRPLRTVASNPGHLLWTGAVTAERALQVARRLFVDDMWSGWGVRTLSRAHPSYNPFSYQLGSVWPHDNVIIAAGLRRYGMDAEAGQVVHALFDAAGHFRSARLPELFAGLQHQPGAFPAQYLGANVPQAWASGSVVHALDVLLGLDASAMERTLLLRPALPEWLSRVEVSNLGVGKPRVRFAVERRDDGSSVLEIQDAGGCRIMIDEDGTLAGPKR